MKKWFMVTLVGKDATGIVAQVTEVLYRGNCHLGEASMSRLGGNFTVMLMVRFDGMAEALEGLLVPVCDGLSLHYHVDEIDGALHHHVQPDVRISVYGADRAGIVAEVTGALAQAGLNILNLESDIAGTEESPIYIMHLEGVAGQGVDVLNEALETLSREKSVETELNEIDVMLG